MNLDLILWSQNKISTNENFLLKKWSISSFECSHYFGEHGDVGSPQLVRKKSETTESNNSGFFTENIEPMH